MVVFGLKWLNMKCGSEACATFFSPHAFFTLASNESGYEQDIGEATVS